MRARAALSLRLRNSLRKRKNPEPEKQLEEKKKPEKQREEEETPEEKKRPEKQIDLLSAFQGEKEEAAQEPDEKEVLSIIWHSKVVWTCAAISLRVMVKTQMSKQLRASRHAAHSSEKGGTKSAFTEVRMMEAFYACIKRNYEKPEPEKQLEDKKKPEKQRGKEKT